MRRHCTSTRGRGLAATSAALSAAVLLHAVAPALAVNNNWPRYIPNILTGNVSIDFPRSEPGVFVLNDRTGEIGVLDESIPDNTVRTPTGWDINDVRFAYDNVTDTMYIGTCGRVATRSGIALPLRGSACTDDSSEWPRLLIVYTVVGCAGINTGPCITGDADCDGDPGRTDTSIVYSGADAADLGATEFAVVVFDFGFNNSAGGFNSAGPGSTVNANPANGFNPAFHAIIGDTGALQALLRSASRRCRCRPCPRPAVSLPARAILLQLSSPMTSTTSAHRSTSDSPRAVEAETPSPTPTTRRPAASTSS
jgi:hypothetical protein